jgi:nucleoside-diphosphate-sugar epimerase
MDEQRGVVLITGASGLLGMKLVQRLRPDHDVVGLDLERNPAWPDDLAFIEADVTDEAGLRSSLEQVRATCGDHLASVVHLIAYYDFTGADSPKYDEVTVEGTRSLVRLLREGFQVGQLIFSSTMLVHAPVTPGEQITEQSPLHGGTPSPRSRPSG